MSSSESTPPSRKRRELSPFAAANAKEEASRYKVARAISSCKRCRVKKQKCDGKMPACSPCAKAKVECVGFDPLSRSNVSRNVLHSLEQENARLRAQVAVLTSGNDLVGLTKRQIADAASRAVSSCIWPDGFGHTSSPNASTSGTSIVDDHTADPPIGGVVPSQHQTSASPSARHMGQTGLGEAASLKKQVSQAVGLRGHAKLHNSAMTSIGPSVTRNAATGPSTSSRSGIQLHAGGATPSSDKNSDSFNVALLPPQTVVLRLLAAFEAFVAVMYPVVHIPTVEKQVMKLREAKEAEPDDVFVVMMVLAMSTMASSRFVDSPDELRARSEIFHAEAIRHMDAVLESPNYGRLQAILLLVWYSMLNPGKGSIWFLVGLATRTCIDLGYYDESNIRVDSMNALELDMRRRVFWCTYEMDRLLSQLLGRPPAIPDGFINVSLPSPLNDVDIHRGQHGPISGETCPFKAMFHHLTRLRRLQSEVLSNTQGIHGTGGVQPEWFDDCFDRLKTWLSTTPEPKGAVTMDGLAIAFHSSCLILFRPSPACPRPGRKALETILSSSRFIIRAYKRMQLNNRFSWLWMTTHYSFMTGLSFLYALLNLGSMAEDAAEIPSMEEAMGDIDSCLSVLDFLSRRVPSASACHDTLKSLALTIIGQLEQNNEKKSLTSSTPLTSTNFPWLPAPPGHTWNDPRSQETYPIPLPPTALPYELKLVNGLFIDPQMLPHRASTQSPLHVGAKSGMMTENVRLGPSNNVVGGLMEGLGFPICNHRSQLPSTTFHFDLAAPMDAVASQIESGTIFLDHQLAAGTDFAGQMNHGRGVDPSWPSDAAMMTQGFSTPSQGIPFPNQGFDGLFTPVTNSQIGAVTNNDSGVANPEDPNLNLFDFLMGHDGQGNGGLWDELQSAPDFSF